MEHTKWRVFYLADVCNVVCGSETKSPQMLLAYCVLPATAGSSVGWGLARRSGNKVWLRVAGEIK